jgi:hypothetical protein
VQKATIDAFVHHVAEAQRILHSAADDLKEEVDTAFPHRRVGTFDKQQAKEWNQIATASMALAEVKDEIVELTPSQGPK